VYCDEGIPDAIRTPRSRYVPVGRNFNGIVRFWQVEKSVTYVFSMPTNIPTPPASTNLKILQSMTYSASGVSVFQTSSTGVLVLEGGECVQPPLLRLPTLLACCFERILRMHLIYDWAGTPLPGTNARIMASND
jgi:hypothetical protein